MLYFTENTNTIIRNKENQTEQFAIFFVYEEELIIISSLKFMMENKLKIKKIIRMNQSIKGEKKKRMKKSVYLCRRSISWLS